MCDALAIKKNPFHLVNNALARKAMLPRLASATHAHTVIHTLTHTHTHTHTHRQTHTHTHTHAHTVIHTLTVRNVKPSH